MRKNSSSADELSNVFNYRGFNLDSDLDDAHRGLDAIYKNLTAETPESPAIDIDSDYEDDERSFSFKIATLLLSNKQTTSELKENFNKTLNQYYDLTLAQFNQVPETTKLSEFVIVANTSEPTLISVSEKKQLVDSVNDWVAFETNDKIKDIVLQSSLPELKDLSCMIFNAAYLKATWKNQYFDREETKEDQFFNEGDINNKKMVPFMQNHKVMLPYYDSLADNDSALASIPFKALEFPFEGAGQQAVSLVVLLPNEFDGLSKLEAALTWSTMESIYNKSELANVQVKLPKFRFEQDYDAREILERMGVKKMFTADAELTEMFKISLKNITMDKVLHKTMIEVDEFGIEAATTAVTNVLHGSSMAGQKDPPKFEANHPFLFVVRHIETNAHLFVGRVVKF